MADEEGEKRKAKRHTKKKNAKRSSTDEHTDGEESRRNTLEASIKAQVAAEQRAHQIVEKLVLEEFATPEYFLEIGNYITHRHYSDVVTERFIIKICGYPLCPKSLINIPKQTFKISTRTNRVYDITERKCFCSNTCYKASKFYESQLDESPIWTRSRAGLKEFTLLCGNKTSISPGNVILGSGSLAAETMNSPKGEVTTNIGYGKEATDGDCVTDDHMIGVKHDNDDATAQVSNAFDKLSLSSEVGPRTMSKIEIKEKSVGQDQQYIEKMSTEETRKTRSVNYNENSVTSVDPSCVTSMNSFDNKSTSVTSHSDLLTTCVTMHDAGISRDDLSSTSVTWGGAMHTESTTSQAFLDSVKEIFLQWWTERSISFMATSSRTCEEKEEKGSTFEEKALHFITHAENSDSEEDEDTTLPKKENSTTSEVRPCVLPPIDSKSQQVIRKRIVLQTLNRVLPEFLHSLGVTVSDISSDLAQLVKTFRLLSQNTMLKTLQWNVVAVVLILMLRHRNKIIKERLETTPDPKSALLKGLGLANEEFDPFFLALEKKLLDKGHSLTDHQSTSDIPRTQTHKVEQELGTALHERREHGNVGTFVEFRIENSARTQKTEEKPVTRHKKGEDDWPMGINHGSACVEKYSEMEDLD
ncbi:putative RNA polymerase II subunit B1 CTD phosphatase RPAP2 isoform X1 [Nematostella vectensis]|uniref:putative RNA polymerase II subunit B1 CTD phosphatase RPAP2 isoform X1 n=1 Tax=Nematostella vectensis TaxID=45351 RepID=UPI002076F067|nr:putative RNA polymerase II subunit B1 CTD phosphatase RPAP2 isoform X1 [Nematostella vectensis]